MEEIARANWRRRFNTLYREDRLESYLDNLDRQILKHQEEADKLSEVVDIGYRVLNEKVKL